VTCRPKGTATGAYGMNGGPCVGRRFRIPRDCIASVSMQWTPDIRPCMQETETVKLAARLDPQNGRESTLQKILAAREPACSGNGCHKGEGGVV